MRGYKSTCTFLVDRVGDRMVEMMEDSEYAGSEMAGLVAETENEGWIVEYQSGEEDRVGASKVSQLVVERYDIQTYMHIHTHPGVTDEGGNLKFSAGDLSFLASAKRLEIQNKREGVPYDYLGFAVLSKEDDGLKVRIARTDDSLSLEEVLEIEEMAEEFVAELGPHAITSEYMGVSKVLRRLTSENCVQSLGPV